MYFPVFQYFAYPVVLAIHQVCACVCFFFFCLLICLFGFFVVVVLVLRFCLFGVFSFIFWFCGGFFFPAGGVPCFFGFFLFVCLAGFSLIQPLRIEVRSKLKRGSGCKLPLGFIAFQFLEYFGSCVHWAITSSRCHANSVECLSMLCTEGSFPHYSVLTKASA